MIHVPHSSDPRPRNENRRFDSLLIFSQLIFAASSLIALVVTLSDRIRLTTTGAEIAFASLLGISYVAGVYVFIRWRRTIQQSGFRIALTGRPKVGKTVFSILMFDSLMNERVPGVKFTAESRSVISVFQAIRSLPRNIWPTETGIGNVTFYSGSIQERRRVVDLEICDSAGEYWLAFDDDKFRDPDYLEYVVTSNAIAHVIDVPTLTASDDLSGNKILDDINDLALASNLKGSVQGRVRIVPLLVVLSKADLVFDDNELRKVGSGLFVPFTIEDAHAIGLARALPSRSMKLLELLDSRLSMAYSSIHFVFSSANSVTDNRLATDHSGSLLSWVLTRSIMQPDRRTWWDRLLRPSPR